jgi:hypothetical protein
MREKKMNGGDRSLAARQNQSEQNSKASRTEKCTDRILRRKISHSFENLTIGLLDLTGSLPCLAAHLGFGIASDVAYGFFNLSSGCLKATLHLIVVHDSVPV